MKMSDLRDMSVDALLELKKTIEKTLTERGTQLRKQLAALNLLDVPKRGRPKGKASNLTGKKVAPKYRGPKGETWAGRGAQPIWLRDLLKKGKKLEEFSVEKKAKGSARPKRKYTKRAKANGVSTSANGAQTAAS